MNLPRHRYLHIEFILDCTVYIDCGGNAASDKVSDVAAPDSGGSGGA